MPEDIQVILLSATMPVEVLEVTHRFMREPIRILVKKEELTLEGIRQFYINIGKEEWKFETLCDLYNTVNVTQAVIFCNTRRKVDWLTNEMTKEKFTVSSMHGEMEQHERDLIFVRARRAFSSRQICSLAASMCSRYRSLSTTTCREIAKTTFIASDAVVVSVEKVSRSTL